MSLVSLLFNAILGQRTTIGVLELDALLMESTSLRSQITEYPVEDGSVISDHITQEAETLTIEGVITGAGTLFNLAHGKAKLIAAKEALRQLHKERALLTVTTGIDIYSDFAIESCEISRTADGGEKFDVNLTLKKIQKVTLRTADIPPEKTSGKATGKAGKTKTNAGKTTGNKLSATQQSKVGEQVAKAKPTSILKAKFGG